MTLHIKVEMMKVCEIIAKKREGKKVPPDEIDFMIKNFTRGEIRPCQMAAFLMAIYIQGMDKEETLGLTRSMIASGKLVDLSPIKGIKVDKHSTGGVGDKTTLVLAPLVASAGVFVAKISGRSLGHTGGTLDKLESIPGFKVNLSKEQFIGQIKEIGVAISSATEDICPADKKIYALRDATATIDSLPLIASSIMSKKVVSGADKIVLDVKTGSGAFVKSLKDAKALAKLLVEMGKELGRETVAAVTDMNQPLGFAIGNTLEVKEAIQTLKGEGPPDLLELSFVLGAEMLTLARAVSHLEQAKKLLKKMVSTGCALQKFGQLIQAQGGNPEVLSQPEVLPQAEIAVDYSAPREGYIFSIDTQKVGEAAVALGTDREGRIDPVGGLVFRKKLGAQVKKGEVIVEIQANDQSKAQEAEALLKQAIVFSLRKPSSLPLIYEVLRL